MLWKWFFVPMTRSPLEIALCPPAGAGERPVERRVFGVDRHFAFFASGRGVGTHPPTDPGEASPALSRSRQPGSRLAGCRQGLWRRFLFRSNLRAVSWRRARSR